MSIKYFLTFAMMMIYLRPSFGQLDSVYYQFDVGSVASGATQTTDIFSAIPISIVGEPKIIPNPEITYTESMIAPINKSEILPPYVYVEDPNATENPGAGDEQTILVQKFPGNPMTNYIPPDCIMAVGPNHIISCVNSEFKIWDKQGNLLKSINAEQWWSPAWPDEAGDPQVIYDQFAGRWVLVWMQYNDVTLTAGNLIAYSDDDNPLGTWYMYRLDTKKHGTVLSNTWGDYPQLGYDDEAIYIATRLFGFTSGYYGMKFRVISKADLYTNTTGPLTYKDFWDIGLPGTPSIKPDGIHPTYSYTAGEGGYFFWANSSGGNYYAVYKIINPLSSVPGLRGDTLHVQNYLYTPNADQLGGGTPLISSNGSQVKTSPVVRDGQMYIAHSVGNSIYPAFASAKYVIYDLPTNSIVEQAELGAEGYYYIYPTITVDKDHNIAVTYSRSATTEYIGAYYSTKHASDPPGLSPSQVLEEGRGNYVVTYGGSRNRWGDYLGIYLDPTNEYDVWLFPEYASATNKWNTVIGQIRMVPFPGVYGFLSVKDFDFGTIETDVDSDTLDFVIANYGLDPLIINSIPDSQGDFFRTSTHSFPITLNSYDSLIVKMIFRPASFGLQSIVYPIDSNSDSISGINLTGFGYDMLPANNKILYGISGLQNAGNTLYINTASGVGTNIGISNYTNIIGMTIHPVTNQIYGISSNSIGSEIYRINAQSGDAYSFISLATPNLYSIAFDKNSDLYGTFRNGEIRKINLETGEDSLVSSTLIFPLAISFNPISNELWGSYRLFIGSPKDLIVKIDLATGDTTNIGQTGFAVNTVDMEFDENGLLYGIKGTGSTISELFSIDTLTAIGTVIGSTGIKDITALGYSLGDLTSINDNSNITVPDKYVLEQNYPNPFNPSTQIKFSLPVNSNVTIIVYNLLGEVVRELVNQEMNAGTHSVQWNAEDASGIKVSSGIYFYELNSTGVNGNQFNQVRKMILLK